MKTIDLTNVQEAGDYSRPTAGAYICTITAVEDNADKEYLKISYDIAEGEYKGYYTKMRADHPEWENAGTYYCSYKPTALGMFKRFCSAVSKSNGKYVFDGATNTDEQSLIGKKVGLIFQDEEYYGNDGSRKTRLIINKEFPISDIATQKVPAAKTLKEDEGAALANNLPANSEGKDAVPWS